MSSRQTGSSGSKSGSSSGRVVGSIGGGNLSPAAAKSEAIPFSLPLNKDDRGKTEHITLRAPEVLCRLIEAVLDDPAVRKSAISRNRFLNWCIFKGIEEAQTMLESPTLGDGLVMLSQMTGRASTLESYLRHKEALTKTVAVAEQLAKEGLKRQAKKLLVEGLEAAGKLEDPEWRQKFKAMLEPKLRELNK